MKITVLAFVAAIVAANANGQPTISEVDTAPVSGNNLQITIKGSDLGSQSPFNGTSQYILVHDVTGNWNAGYSGDAVNVNVTSWTSSEIYIANFSGALFGSVYKFNVGDQLQVEVWNSGQSTTYTLVSLPSNFTIAPSINLTGNLAFGNVATNQSATATLTIDNTGNAPMYVSGITYSGNFGAGVFSGNWTGYIPAGGSHPVTITFTPAAVTSYSGTLGVNSDASSGASSIAISGNGTGPPTIVTASPLPLGAEGRFYSTSFTATGGTTPYTWQVASGNSDGLSFNGNALSGTPTSATTNSFKVKVTGNNSLSSTNTFTLPIETPPTITTSSQLSGTVGISYSQTFPATGGTQPYTWAWVSGNLPTGLSFSGNVVSGTPKQAITDNFLIKVTDAAGISTTNSFSLTIASPLQITTTSLNRGMVGRSYSDQLYAQGEQQPWTWSVQGLPSGLSLDPYANGLIDGTPQGSANTYQVTIDVEDQYGNWAPSKTLPLVVSSPLLITTPATLPNATQYQSYSTSFSATGGSGSYSWTSGNLPSWLNLSSSGALNGIPTSSGAYNFTAQVSDGSFSASQTFYLTVNAAPTVATPVINPASETVTNQSVLVTMSCATPGATIHYTTDGTDPNESSQTYSPFIISQPPTGSLTVTVKAIGFASGYNQSAETSATYTIIIPPTGPTITTTSPLSTGTVGTFYGPLTFIATGGTGSYNWSRGSGTLPPGLTLTSGGLLSGTPTNSGTYNFTVQVTDANNSSEAMAFNLTIIPASTPTGGLAGLVLGNGSPIANAQVRIENTTFSTSTLSDGTFALSNIPVGYGYILDVSATGYASSRLTSVNVPVGSTNLGNIILTNASGSISLIPLVPDVNPAITTVEQGGTAYRYYKVLSTTNSGVPLGDIPVFVQIEGGSPIVQTNDVSNYWPGQIAGISDADGVVRVSIPASALGAVGTFQTVQLSVGGQVQQGLTFLAQIVASQYDQVWKQKLGSGVSVGELITAGLDTSAESDLRHKIIGGVVSSEYISRIQTVDATVGAGVSLGSSLSVSSANFNLSSGNMGSAGANAFAAIGLRSTFSFDPNTTDPGQNAMKLYVDLGNVLSGVPGPQAAFYDFVEETIEPSFLDSNLRSVEGDVQVGGGYGGQVDLNIANVGPVQVSFDASTAASMEFIFGYETTFGSTAESASVQGITASGSAMVGVVPSLNLGGAANLTLNNNLTWQTSSDVELLAKSWTLQGQSGPYRTESVRKLELTTGEQNPVPAWKQYDPQSLYANYDRDFTETLQQTNGNSITSYKWSVYAGQQELGVNLNLDLGLGVSLQGELDQGAEIVNERGAILQSRYWPAESNPALTPNLFPTQSWSSILSQWGNNALGPIGQAVNQAITTVANAGNTIVQAGQATLNIAGGAINSGAQVISSWASDLSHISLVVPAGKPIPLGGPIGNTATYFPPDGSSNYIYGIDGVYRFESTNAFSGSATLTIPYNPADVSGLDPTQLQIYELPDGTNRWQLVGGVVDTESNTVTATITNLGTYAIAPPLPTGNLQLIPSTNALIADGVSTMTVVVTNLMLNNGNIATQQWLFTASATGVQILNANCDTNLPGIQVVSTNGTVTLSLQAPSCGNVAQISLVSVAGDASGSIEVNLIDNTAPATPTNVVVTAGQSRIWVSWATNSESDLAGYRVYYNAGTAGPPWSGTAAIEGSPSPVQVTGTNCLLRGLTLGTNYFVAVSAVDTSGNESTMSSPNEVTTIQVAPTPPTDVAVRFGSNGTNVLMWALSEDDGYNDRDVTNYYIWRAILPGGSYTNVGQVAAGIGVYTEANPALSSTQSVSYAVSAVAGSDLSSTQVVAIVIAPSSVVSTNVVIGLPQFLPNGSFQFTVQGSTGQTNIIQTSTNLINWVSVCTNTLPFVFSDTNTSSFPCRFYRVMTP